MQGRKRIRIIDVFFKDKNWHRLAASGDGWREADLSSKE